MEAIIEQLSPKFKAFFSHDELEFLIKYASLIYDEVIIFLGWEHFIEIYCDGVENVEIYILHKKSDRVLPGTKEKLFAIIEQERANELRK